MRSCGTFTCMYIWMFINYFQTQTNILGSPSVPIAIAPAVGEKGPNPMIVTVRNETSNEVVAHAHAKRRVTSRCETLGEGVREWTQLGRLHGVAQD